MQFQPSFRSDESNAMKTLPLTRARHASNFAVALEDLGEPAERLLERTRLPAEFLDSIGGDGVISAVNMLDFAETAARHTGILDLGFRAGLVPVEQYGQFGRHVASAPSLHSAIVTFCREVRGECSEADYYLTFGETSAWFCHGPVGATTEQQSQHELYALMIITQVIQLALGSGWKPARIRLQSRDESGARDNDFLSKTSIEFGAPITAVEFPLEGLATPLQYTSTRAYSSRKHDATAFADRFPEDPVDALKELIATYTRQSQQPTIQHAAELAGVSKRTLQRFLKNRATTYSELVDQVRFDLALPLLSDRSYSITDISVQLGYSNVAHFSRAFKRITGMSPHAYRKICQQ